MVRTGQMDSSLTFMEAGPKVRSEGRYGRTRVTLGIMPDFMDSDDHEGMRVDMVTPGRPAALGGIRKGDYIIAIEGKSIENVYDYMYRLSKIEPGQQIVVTVLREEEKLDLLIQL
jgi:S1-C subfamily serine protease